MLIYCSIILQNYILKNQIIDIKKIIILSLVSSLFHDYVLLIFNEYHDVKTQEDKIIGYSPTFVVGLYPFLIELKPS